MSALTGISWCDSTFNPWVGCTKVSPGCDHCYAERDMDQRRHFVKWGPGQTRRRTSAANWKLPERWNRESWIQCACGFRGASVDGGGCGACGKHATSEPTRRRVFCASLADWLDNEVPIEWLVDLLDLIRRTPNLDWLLLTKRIGNWRTRFEEALSAIRDQDALGLYGWLEDWLAGNAPRNAWIGMTGVTMTEFRRDRYKLFDMDAAVRFVSIEPQLEMINAVLAGLIRWNPGGDYMDGGERAYDEPSVDRLASVDWVICGGESGPHARPLNPEWVRALRDQCQEAGVAFHFKQNGEWASVSEVAGDGPHFSFPDGATVRRVGKKLAGRTLDGRTWDQFPRDGA